MSLARGIIPVPTNRPARAISEAFVRRAETCLLLARFVPPGDLDLDEKLGRALDPIGEDVDNPPAIAPMERQMILARMVQDVRAASGQPVDAGEIGRASCRERVCQYV